MRHFKNCSSVCPLQNIFDVLHCYGPRCSPTGNGTPSPLVRRSPSRIILSVRSTADFRPDLDLDAGRTTECNGHYWQTKWHRFGRH